MSRVLADIFKAHDAQWLGVRCLYLGPYLQGTMTLSRPPKFEPLTLFYFNFKFFLWLSVKGGCRPRKGLREG